LSSILNGKIKKAKEIIAEIDSMGKTVGFYRELINLVIDWVSEGKKVKLENLPFHLRKLVEGSEEMMYILSLFKKFQPPPSLLS
jgi:hypothetical protein